MNDDQLASELRRRAGAADVPDLLPPVRSAMDAGTTKSVTSWPALAGLAGALGVLALLVFAIPRLAPSAQPSPSGTPVTSSQTVGDFTLTLSSPHGHYLANEPIDVEAILRYDGDGPTVVSSASSMLGFGLRQLDGSLEMAPGFRLVCIPRTIQAGEVERSQYVKSGGFSDDDPQADFWQTYFEDPILRLPEGTWELSVSTSLGGRDCSAMAAPSASIVITVGVAAIQSAVPTPERTDLITPEPSPAPPTIPNNSPTPGTVNQVDCTRLDDPTRSDWRVSVTDRTGLIATCEEVDRSTDPDRVTNPGGDKRLLIVQWTEGICAHDTAMDFAGTQGSYDLRVTPVECILSAGAPRAVLLHMRSDVEASSVALVLGHPDASPPQVGTVMACDGAPNAPESGSVSIVDHTGLVMGCEVADGPNPDEASVTSAPAPPRLVVEWVVPCTSDPLVSRLEFWHREPSGGPADPSRFQPPYLLMVNRAEPVGVYGCLDALSGRTVEIDLRDDIASGDVEMFFTDGARRGLDIEPGNESHPNFELSITGSKTDYVEGEAIEVSSSLVSDAAVTLTCGTHPLIAMEQLDGPLDFHPGPFLLACPPPIELQGGAPVTSNFLPAVWAYQEPHPLDPYMRDGKLYLPPGSYRFVALTSFDIGESPSVDRVELEASVVITVR